MGVLDKNSRKIPHICMCAVLASGVAHAIIKTESSFSRSPALFPRILKQATEGLEVAAYETHDKMQLRSASRR